MLIDWQKGKSGMARARRASLALCLLLASPVLAAGGYAPLARAYLAEPIVVVGTVRGSKKVPKDLALAPAGQVRQLIEVDIARVLKSPGPVNARITYLWEGPADTKGRAPSFKKQTLMLFLRATPRPDVPFRLAGTGNQMAWSADAESRLRAIALEAQTADLSSLRLTGIQSAFTSDTDPPFARLSQFLFASVDNRLIGVTVRVRPDGTGDVIRSSEEFLGGGTGVQANTLLWYHLACTTPATVPADILADQPTDDERALLTQDYTTLKKALGPCA